MYFRPCLPSALNLVIIEESLLIALSTRARSAYVHETTVDTCCLGGVSASFDHIERVRRNKYFANNLALKGLSL